MRTGLLIVALAAGNLLSGCGETFCTEEGIMSTIHVVNGTGDSVEGVALTVTNTRTGEVLVPPQNLGLAPGLYRVVTDSDVPSFAVNGDELQVTGVLGDATFTETYILRADRCHITALEGPPEVMLVQ